MPASSVSLKALGLNYSPNQLSLPDGSLVTAKDVIIRRDNVVESRRGFREYSQTINPKQLIEYKERLLCHHGSTLSFDTGLLDTDGKAIFNAFSGTYSETQDGLRIKSIEANKNLYFTTSKGIKKISAKSASNFTSASNYIVDAGAIRAVDLTGELNVQQGQLSGFLPNDSAVAYRVLFGYKDDNNNLILGYPSDRIVVYNYLEDVISMDLNTLLTRLDSINQAGCLINDGNYSSTYQTPLSTLASTLRTNILGLASKLDNDILLANDTGVDAPLNMHRAERDAAGLVTILFDVGDPSLYIQEGDSIELRDLTGPSDKFKILNGTHTVTNVTSTTIQFIFGTGALSNDHTGVDAKLFSNNYRQITKTGDDIYTQSLDGLVLSIPPTSEDLRIIHNTLNRIVTRLKNELPGVIPAILQQTYISPFIITENANVELEITIPTDLPDYYFVQVYRTRTFTAEGVQSLGIGGGISVEPDDEMRLVFEQFPTSSEISSGQLVFLDNYPEDLILNNTNLYTNPVTGEGILQANNAPPFAKDINRFKNTVFYANTRTKHRITPFQLLGVSQITPNSKITIASSLGTDTYKFVQGVQEVTDIDITQITTGDAGKYFVLRSAVNDDTFVFWLSVNNTLGSQPSVSGATRYVKIPLFSTNSPYQNASIVSNIINTEIYDFSSELTDNYIFNVSAANVNANAIYTKDTPIFVFTVTAASANAGAVYTNNTHNFTVSTTISGGTVLTTTGTDFPTTSGTLTKVSGGGDATITFSSYELTNKFTVLNTISGGTVLNTVGVNFPSTTSGTLNKISGTGADSITFSSYKSKIQVTNVEFGKTSNASAGTSPFTVTTITDGDGEDASTKQILLSSAISAAQAIDETARSFVRVINKQSTSPVYAYYISSETTPPGQIFFESKTLDDNVFYIMANNAVTGLSFNPDISPINTNISNISTGTTTVTITTSTPHGLINNDNIVISGSNSTPIVDGLHTVTVTGSNIFTIPVSSTVTLAGNLGSWSKTSDVTVSENETKPNRIYYSKFQQPEAVPLLNYFDVGPEDKEILRIFPLRDSLFVFKEDGLYRISGETAPFVVSLFDGSCILLAPDSVDDLDNVIYCWTNKGISNVTETGVNEISRPIDTEILRVSSNEFANFKKLTWGFGYNSDNSYTVYTNANTIDTEATVGFRFSNLTNTWTNIDRAQTCGLILSVDDKLYMGSIQDSLIHQERKSFTRKDYADRDFSINLTSGSLFNDGRLLEFTNVSDIEIGDVLTQEQTVTIYYFNALLQQLDLDPSLQTDYLSTLKANKGDNMRTKLLALATKLDADPGTNFSNYLALIDDYTGNISNNLAGNPTIINTINPHNLITGRQISIFGTQSPASTPIITGQHKITNIGSTQFSIPVSVNTGGGSGLQFTTVGVSQGFDDLLVCFNAIIQNLNADTGVTFSDYSEIDDNTLFEAVVIDINYSTKQVILNLPLDWIIGNMRVYKAIDCQLIYAPQTFGDPLMSKQVFETTMMFSNKAFTKMTASFSSDLKPEFKQIQFFGQGNGIFGHYSEPGFGYGFFGGSSNSAPFRTIIPRQTQRCRFINVALSHKVAREQWALFGITLTANIGQSTRAYR